MQPINIYIYIVHIYPDQSPPPATATDISRSNQFQVSFSMQLAQISASFEESWYTYMNKLSL